MSFLSLRRALALLMAVGSSGLLTLACGPVARDFDKGTGGAGGTGGTGGTGGSCAEGTEGCPCASGDTCAPGLDCAKGVCIKSVCQCTAGYAMMDGQCVWTGSEHPVDPGFQQASAWQTVKGAEVQPAAPGSTEAGAGVIGPKASCAFGGLAQTFDMLPYACAEPLLLTLQTQLDCQGLKCLNGALAIGVNGGWNRVALPGFSPGWTKRSLCLGERGYGGPVTLFVGAAGCTNGNMNIDDVAIVPDAMKQCPAPGQVLNGNFEAGAEQWTPSPNSGIAEVAKGAGSGSYAGHLATSQLCQSPQIVGTGSLPLDATTPHPALRVWHKGSLGTKVNVSLGGLPFGELTEEGAPLTTAFCLPSWAQGTAQPISFALFSGSGTCADASVKDFVFDDVAFVSEPDCPASGDILDPGFENVINPKLAPTWQLNTDSPGTGAAMDVGAGAHAGSVALELSVQNLCSTAIASTVITVPAPSKGGGPALKFWYRAPTLQTAIASVFAGGAPLTPTASWAQSSVCLNPGLAGRPLTVSFQVGQTSGTCATTFPKETVWFDDLTLGTDPSCPAE